MKKFLDFLSLKESQEFKKLAIYDFDGTLFKSPEQDEGIKRYESLTGKPWPFKGWWGKLETLLPPLVPQKPSGEWFHKNVVSSQRIDASDPSTTTIMMTGRHIGFKNRILEILENYNIKFDDTYFAGQPGSVGSSTFEIKSNNIRKLVQGQKFNILEIYEDRIDHVHDFENFSKKLIESNLIEKAFVHDVTNNRTIEV